MGWVDSLSKQPDWQIGIERDNEDRVLVKKEWLEVKVIQVMEVVIEEVDLLEKIRKSEAKNDKVIKTVEEMKWAGVKILRDKEWREENSLILRDRKVYILWDEKLRAEVIWLYHDTLIGGYGKQ